MLGNLEDFGKLYDTYVRKIYDFIYYKTHHRETAEDLTSQTFFKALQNIKNFDIVQGSFSAWLYTIARNTVIDHYRTAKLHVDLEDIWDLPGSQNVHLDAENREALDKVREYLKELDPEHREIVVMRVWNGLSYKEIAETLGKSEDSCKMMFSRVITKLREKLPVESLLILLALGGQFHGR